MHHIANVAKGKLFRGFESRLLRHNNVNRSTKGTQQAHMLSVSSEFLSGEFCRVLKNVRPAWMGGRPPSQ